MFKVGDRVVSTYSQTFKKETGTIVAVASEHRRPYDYCILMDNPKAGVRFNFRRDELSDEFKHLKRDTTSTWWVKKSDIKHCRVTYTRLAEKLYPKGHKDGKWWVLHGM